MIYFLSETSHGGSMGKGELGGVFPFNYEEVTGGGVLDLSRYI